MVFGLDWDTLVGVAFGVGTVAYLWAHNRNTDLDKSYVTNSDGSKTKKSLRDFQVEDLARYDGSGENPKPMYVAVDGIVFDVGSKATSPELLEFAGKQMLNGNVQEFKSKYTEVGRLIIQREYTVDEIFGQDGRNGKPIWIAAKGVVYDVTRGADFYGPEEAYGIMAGRDASRALALVSLDQKDVDNTRLDDLTTQDLYTLDEWVAKFEFKYTKIGTLKDWSLAGSPKPSKLSASSSSKNQEEEQKKGKATTDLDDYKSSPTWLTKEKQQIELSEKIPLSPDTFLFRFKFPSKEMRLGLPIGKHIKVWCPNPKPVKEGEWNGKPDPESGKAEIERKYTPSSLDANALGHFDVIIKVYSPNERFCDGGKMSRYFGDLKVGDQVSIAGPFGLIEYQGRGNFFQKKQVKHFKYLGMLAGGTGVTPMLQIIQAILRDPEDHTMISLLFGNQTEKDILCRDMLEDLARKHPTRFRLHLTLDRPPSSEKEWKGFSGFITEDMIRQTLPPPGPSTAILMCGPPPMLEYACKPNLLKIGYEKDHFFEF